MKSGSDVLNLSFRVSMLFDQESDLLLDIIDNSSGNKSECISELIEAFPD